MENWGGHRASFRKSNYINIPSNLELEIAVDRFVVGEQFGLDSEYYFVFFKENFLRFRTILARSNSMFPKQHSFLIEEGEACDGLSIMDVD